MYNHFTCIITLPQNYEFVRNRAEMPGGGGSRGLRKGQDVPDMEVSDHHYGKGVCGKVAVY